MDTFKNFYGLGQGLGRRPAAVADLPLHPYYPLGVAIPGYVENTLSTPIILGYFSGICAALLLPPLWYLKRGRRGLPSSEIATALWFVLCGFIHLGLEGYFAFNFAAMGSGSDLLGQMWKEYAFSDSRYLTADSFVVCMEAMTAIFWGPLSFACAYSIAVDHPLRHVLQLVISLGQLYGDVLYYATCTFEEMVRGVSYSRPERVYFWGYYIFLNAFWIIIPLVLMYQSITEIRRVFDMGKNLEKTVLELDDLLAAAQSGRLGKKDVVEKLEKGKRSRKD